MIKLFTHKIGGAKKILSLALLLGAAFVQQAIADTVEPSTILPTEGTPENLYTMQCGNDRDNIPAYVAKTLYPTTTAGEYARFAFYAVEGKSDTYQIYCYDAQKWLTYTATSSFSTGVDKITLSSSQVSNTYFKVSQITTGSYVGTYEIQPYTTSGTTTGHYLNYFGGIGVNMNGSSGLPSGVTQGWHTIGLWTDDGRTDKGSHWTFHDAMPKAVITNKTAEIGSIVTKVLGDTSYSPNGTSFTKDLSIDWSTQKVSAEIDVTNCASKTEDIFSIGDDALSFNTVNIHLYRNATGGYSSYTSSGQHGCAVTSGIPNSTKLVNIELSKANGFVVNGKTVFTASQLENHSGIFKLSNLKVGSGEGTNQQTKATYNYINVVTVDYAQATTSTSDVIKEATNNTFEAQNNVKVSLDRTISSSYWNTFCLPFAVSEEMVNDVFGSDCQIREYDNMDGTTMNFKSASSIEAGKPYLIKPASDVVNPTFTGVSIVAGDPVAVPTSGSYQMKGTYGLTDLATDGTNLFLGDQDKFYIPSVSGKTMKGMRAYFIVPSGTSATALRANIDGNVTAISSINGAEVVGAAPVYNLQGQYVGTTLDGLPRGIYVQNGKKMVVR